MAKKKKTTYKLEDSGIVLSEDTEIVVTATDIVDQPKVTLKASDNVTIPTIPTSGVFIVSETSFKKWLSKAPVVQGNLTLRWYGETFVPAYKAWLEEGRQLATQT